MLWELLKEQLIFPNLKAKSSTEVLRKLGSTLIEQGYADDGYIDELIERELDYPTGLDLDFIGIAIPHTQTSMIKKDGIAIATLNNPVDWMQISAEDEHVAVKIVFMLAVKNPTAHLKNNKNLIELFDNPSKLRKIANAKKAKEIINTLTKS